MKRFSLTKRERIQSNIEFRAVLRLGRKIKTAAFDIYIKGSGQTQNRLGISVSKRVGTAVCRNHLKRRIREWFRQNKPRIISADLVFIFKKPDIKDFLEDSLTILLREVIREKD